MSRSHHSLTRALALLPAVLGLCLAATASAFDVADSSVAQVHAAIKSGEVTCKGVVQGYLDRARAYNGICTALVTADGKPAKSAKGLMRAGAPIAFPRQTVAIDKILPDFAQYKGLPIEYGHLSATASDPTVVQQRGMVAGIANAGQVNALTTLAIRGERSVTCKGKFDAHPSTGALPKGAPAACEQFRQQPDALERAAELDAKYGRNPDLEALPMYCIPWSFKDALDVKDLRSTSGADVAYAMDVPSQDATIVDRLRARGAIVLAKANLSEYNGGGGNPGGIKAGTATFGAAQVSTWGGTACNPYDTAVETGGSSSGSAAGVSAGLAHCSICEETGGSCRQPAWRNGVVGLVVTKGLMPYGGAIGGDPYVDRPGIVCRSVDDAARALDAMRDPVLGYFDPRDIYSALPRSIASKAKYASFTAQPAGGRPLSGVKIAIVREYMVKHTKNDEAISDLADAEIKKVLRDQLGAELVETADPLYPDDPTVPNLSFDFQKAFAEVLTSEMPDYVAARNKEGKPLFPVEGEDLTSVDYLVRAAEGKAEFSDGINLRSINTSPAGRSKAFAFHLQQYLARRGDAKVHDWVTLNANATYDSEGRAVAMKNWENTKDVRSENTQFRVRMRDAARMALMKVMLQNDIDVLVNPTITIPAAKIGFPSPPTVNDRPVGRFPTAANLGIPEITVPGGYNQVVYEPQYKLNAAKDDYDEVSNETTASRFDNPMPFGISFWGGPGDEAVILRIAAAYEGATHHRKLPPAFPPVAVK